MKLKNLQIQIDSDLQDLLSDIQAGLFTGNFDDEEKMWKRLGDKISLYRNMRAFEREQNGIMEDERLRMEV